MNKDQCVSGNRRPHDLLQNNISRIKNTRVYVCAYVQPGEKYTRIKITAPATVVFFYLSFIFFFLIFRAFYHLRRIRSACCTNVVFYFPILIVFIRKIKITKIFVVLVLLSGDDIVLTATHAADSPESVSINCTRSRFHGTITPAPVHKHTRGTQMIYLFIL